MSWWTAGPCWVIFTAWEIHAEMSATEMPFAMLKRLSWGRS